MDTITLKINKRTKTGRTFLELVRIFSREKGVEVVPKGKTPNLTTRKAIQDNEKGIGVKKFSSVDELFKELES